MNKLYDVSTITTYIHSKLKKANLTRHWFSHENRFWGAIVDSKGNENLITDQMVSEACEALEYYSYVVPKSKGLASNSDYEEAHSKPSALKQYRRSSSNICAFPIRK